MADNPYEAPQAVIDNASTWSQANIIATIRASVAEFGLSLAVICLLVFPFITFVPGSEKGAFKIPALLGSAGLLHPYRLPFLMGVSAMAALGLLTLISG